MKHCRGCSHPTICDSHGCGADEARAIAALKAGAEAARAEEAAMRKDAERYRWLRDNTAGDWCICSWGDDDQQWYREARSAGVVDRAIDAAMALHNA